MRGRVFNRAAALLRQAAQATVVEACSFGVAAAVKRAGGRVVASFRNVNQVSSGARLMSSFAASGATAGAEGSSFLRAAVAYLGIPALAAALFYSQGNRFMVVAADASYNDAKVVIKLPDGTQVIIVGPPKAAALKKKVVIFEVEGGTDKGPDGHRKDTMPIANSLKKRGYDCEVIFYRDDKKDEIYKHVLETADGFISRINPGKYPTYTESKFFDMARKLYDNGLVAMPHPDAMTGYGAKDALVKIRETPSGLLDTYAYYEVEDFKKQFPASIALNDRVLKQNRGSTGEGIWVVKPHGWSRGTGYKLTKDTLLSCTEMSDNHTEIRKLGDFMDFCDQYIIGENGMLVDQRFLPRIVEGEVRVLMIYDQPVNVVHKKPSEGNFSATLFSGAKYTYDSPDDPKWKPLVSDWLASMPLIKEKMGGFDYPLIWTADFILDTDKNGKDLYRLGEMNCSCVGFTTQLELADTVADAAIRLVQEKKK